MVDRNGFIKLDRCLLQKHIFKNEKILKVWVWCLLRANHSDQSETVGLKEVPIKPGQFITGRYKAAEELRMNPSTAWKYLKWLEKNQSIVINSNNKFSVVTVINWDFYQVEKYKGDNKMTTKKQQNDTDKNVKNDQEKIPYVEIIDFLNSEAGKNYKHSTQKTREKIKARWNEGFRLDDFKAVIINKTAKWKNDKKYSDFLRPETLFGTKFEGYLNEKAAAKNKYPGVTQI